MSYQFNWSIVLAYWPQLAEGLLFTVQLIAVSYSLSLVIGLVVGLMRLASLKPLRLAAFAYTQVFRAVSTYISIIWIYFGVAIAFGINPSPFAAGVLSIVLLNSAYMAEIYRSSISSVDSGQKEAAFALGMGNLMTFLDVIMPQAARVAAPQLINQFTYAVKDSAIVALIGAHDLMNVTIRGANTEFRSFEFYTTAAAIYLAIVFVVSGLGSLLERRLSLGYSR